MSLDHVTERVLNGLIQEAQHPALMLLACAADSGVALRVTDGYRSFAKQRALYAQGRKPLAVTNELRTACAMAAILGGENQRIVTRAEPGHSWHNWKRAIDVVPMVMSIPDWRSGHWDAIGQMGEALGFEWGGRWPSGSTDRPHFQWTHGTTLVELLAEHPNGLDD